MLYDRAHRRMSEFMRAENEDGLLTIGPRIKLEHRFKGLSTNHHRINGVHKLSIAVRFASALWQEVKLAVCPRDKPVQTSSDEYGCFQYKLSFRGFALKVSSRTWIRSIPHRDVY